MKSTSVARGWKDSALPAASAIMWDERGVLI
jgi:hypothetical protein